MIHPAIEARRNQVARKTIAQLDLVVLAHIDELKGLITVLDLIELEAAVDVVEHAIRTTDPLSERGIHVRSQSLSIMDQINKVVRML